MIQKQVIKICVHLRHGGFVNVSKVSYEKNRKFSEYSTVYNIVNASPFARDRDLHCDIVRVDKRFVPNIK